MSEKSPTRLVVFDCDGTLVDSQHVIVAALQAAFGARDVAPPEPESIRAIVGLSLLEAMAVLAPESPEEVHRDLVDSYRSNFTALRQRPEHQDALFPGAAEILDDLMRAGFLLGMATGKSRRGLDATLQRHALDGRFITLQTADVAPSKPHPAMLERAMTEAGTVADHTVLVGDTTYDMEMAVNAGVTAIGVSWGYHPQDALRRAGAYEVVNDFAELMPLLRAMSAKPGDGT